MIVRVVYRMIGGSSISHDLRHIMHSKRLSRTLTIGFLTIVSLLMAFTVRAQDDGTLRIEDEQVGDYRLSVWSSPEPAIVGKLHITARLAPDGADDQAPEPEIMALAHAPHKDVLESAMIRDVSGLYVTDFDIPYAGEWTIELVVTDGGSEERASFPVDIQPAPINKNLIRLGAFLMLVVLGTGWWFWGRHPRKKRVRKRIFMPRPDED